jgi:hypothetical protein
VNESVTLVLPFADAWRSVTVLGLTATVTARAAWPLCPSLEAVIVVAPTATAVTIPESDDVAVLWLLDFQTMVRPLSTLLLESRIVAVAWVVWPTLRESVTKATLTEATGALEGMTVRVALPLFSPRVAIMLATPGDIALTTPEALTVATELSLDLHAALSKIWRP